nr:MAG TPA: hypothetical protein [Caudoviricetes sp.]
MKNKYFSINEFDTPIAELPKVTPEYGPGESPRELLEKQIATLEKSQKDMEQLLELTKNEAKSAKKSSRISFVCTVISISVSVAAIVVPLLLK